MLARLFLYVLAPLCSPRRPNNTGIASCKWVPHLSLMAAGEDVGGAARPWRPGGGGSVLDALTALPGVRLAEPGEFTRRAFEVGQACRGAGAA